MKNSFAIFLVLTSFLLVGCEPQLGGWPAFKWKVISVSNPTEISVGIGKDKKQDYSYVLIRSKADAGSVELNVDNYSPWLSDIRTEFETERPKEDYHYRAYEWGDIILEGSSVRLNFTNLSESYQGESITIHLDAGDAFSRIIIERV